MDKIKFEKETSIPAVSDDITKQVSDQVKGKLNDISHKEDASTSDNGKKVDPKKDDGKEAIAQTKSTEKVKANSGSKADTEVKSKAVVKAKSTADSKNESKADAKSKETKSVESMAEVDMET